MSARREYAPELVERVRHLYVDRGMSQVQVADQIAEIGTRGVKVIMLRHEIPRRGVGKWGKSGNANPNWSEAAPDYTNAHRRIRSARGSAEDYSCFDCGGQACDWSYNHSDPDEMRADGNTRPYSSDPDHYSPRCRKCHRAFDRAAQGRCQQGHEINADNTYVSPQGRRNCRPCRRGRAAANYRVRKAALNPTNKEN